MNPLIAVLTPSTTPRPPYDAVERIAHFRAEAAERMAEADRCAELGDHAGAYRAWQAGAQADARADALAELQAAADARRRTPDLAAC
jgi:hypothetical protein